VLCCGHGRARWEIRGRTAQYRSHYRVDTRCDVCYGSHVHGLARPSHLVFNFLRRFRDEAKLRVAVATKLFAIQASTHRVRVHLMMVDPTILHSRMRRPPIHTTPSRQWLGGPVSRVTMSPSRPAMDVLACMAFRIMQVSYFWHTVPQIWSMLSTA
jgi:hypothetical protein